MNLLIDKDTDFMNLVISVYELENKDLHILFQNDEFSGERILSPDEPGYDEIKDGNFESLYKEIQTRAI